MRFTLIDSKKKSPSFERKRGMQFFLSIAAAEIMMLMLMVVLFIKLRGSVDVPLMVSGMLIVIGVLTYFIRKSAIIAHSVLMFCVLALQIMLYMDLPKVQLGSGNIRGEFTTTDALPFLFVAIDILLVRWILSHGIKIETEDAPPVKTVRALDFEERTRR
ncbi:Uncharacterised protein [uncultured archaeon]|nr:Uncharacterised protein [uncultured archaeon]